MDKEKMEGGVEVKASELIRLIEAKIEEVRDVEVYIWPYDGQARIVPPEVLIADDGQGQPIIYLEGN